MTDKFSFEQFTNLMRQSPVKAFAYRDRMKSTEEKVVEVSAVSEIMETKEITIERDEMKAILKNAEISFKENTRNPTLLNLIKENGLI